jgi:hypothetical protein
MDVVLDANIYLADPRMEGVAFKSLLDYLRKKQSTLIIPQIVFDEVIARYPDLLSAQSRKAGKEVHAFRRLMLGPRNSRGSGGRHDTSSSSAKEEAVETLQGR